MGLFEELVKFHDTHLDLMKAFEHEDPNWIVDSCEDYRY